MSLTPAIILFVCLLASPDAGRAGDELGRTDLMYAAASGDTAAVTELLEAGADVHARDQAGNTALFFLPESGDPEIVRKLLDAGARADETNRAGHSPLRAAALLGHVDVARLLLARGARADDDAGREAFAQAVLRGHFDVAELLLQAGTEIDGQGLLCRLAERGDEPAVKFLLEHGASTETRVVDDERFLGDKPAQTSTVSAAKPRRAPRSSSRPKKDTSRRREICSTSAPWSTPATASASAP